MPDDRITTPSDNGPTFVRIIQDDRHEPAVANLTGQTLLHISVPFGKYWRSSPLVFSQAGLAPNQCAPLTCADAISGRHPVAAHHELGPDPAHPGMAVQLVVDLADLLRQLGVGALAPARPGGPPPVAAVLG